MVDIQLQNENEDLKKALSAIEKHLEMTLGKFKIIMSLLIFNLVIVEKDQINALYDDFRVHYEQIKV